ncbi:MAG: hypothetical protein UY48_C0006G0013 [Candidatus Gottesmanbacteria bacterium GW2011_GWB1_49_7]|uniref:Uncharacterized protein n=1 Tax=Candidatus Gottesmanbacteria bacterium GW2011_GWB1_49_7 TaxID=1618448 RepID=A0A0G1W2Z2_9BACT|nr:MAG: hypothetical protein UY48_C0006G0013 [Candidatus Gottesmanbacteria bacterium GW2011_GWB1_49_7]
MKTLASALKAVVGSSDKPNRTVYFKRLSPQELLEAIKTVVDSPKPEASKIEDIDGLISDYKRLGKLAGLIGPSVWNEIKADKAILRKLEEEFKKYVSRLLPEVNVKFQALSNEHQFQLFGDVPNAPSFAGHSVHIMLSEGDTTDYENGFLSEKAKDKIKKGLESLVEKKAVYTRNGEPLKRLGN